MALLSNLPAEILHLVTRYLAKPEYGFSDDGLCSLRLTCRALCLKTQYEFGRAAFSTLRLDLHPKTLQRLLNICKVPAFGKAVKKIVFAHWGDEYIAFPPVSDCEGAERLKDQALFVLDQIFAEAFSGTPNLKEMVLVTPCIARFRRHPYSLEAGFPTPTTPNYSAALDVEDFCLTMERLYVLVAHALSTSNVQLSALETTMSPMGRVQHLKPVASISTQSLNLTAQALRYVQHLKVTLDASEMSNADGYLWGALRNMSLLTRLDIGFHGRGSGWASVVVALKSLGNFRFPRLMSFVLSTAQVEESVLGDFLLMHKATLQQVALCQVSLEEDAHWGSTLALLLDKLGRLEELCFTCYNTRKGPRSFDLVGRLTVVRHLGSILGRM